MLIFSILLALQISKILSQVDCTCGSSVESWQCTDEDGEVHKGGEAGYGLCVDERDDIWEDILDCRYCYKCVGDVGLGQCECDTQANCSDLFVVVGIIMIILGLIFFIWQGIVIWKFFAADGECKDVWRICGCFVVGLACLIIGILMIADQSIWFGLFS